jgi:hypothetical protein
MATIQELEQALINADAAGDVAAARDLAAAITSFRATTAGQIPGEQVVPAVSQLAEPTLAGRAVGAGEAALTLGTGAVGGTLGMVGGTLKGLAEQILSGQFGTPQAANLVEQSAAKGAQALTYAPRTQAGREQVQAVGEALSFLPPVVPVVGAPGAVVGGARMAAPAVAEAARKAAPQVQAAVQKVAAPVKRAAAAATMKAPAQPPATTAPAGVSMGTAMAPEESVRIGARESVGAAAVPSELQRRIVAETMPVPFEKGAALTKGQASRDFSQLQFEKETAKIPEGQPLRERVENQTAVFLQNFDAMIDRAGPINVDPRDIGKAVDRAMVNKAEVKRKQIQSSYDAARQAGELAQPVEMTPLAAMLDDLTKYEKLSPNIGAVRKEAERLGAVAADETGALVPKQITLNDSETLRQFVNVATDWTDRREALFGRRITSAIDAATQDSGGDLYKKARKTRAQFADEFENVGLTAKLLGTKGKTNERAIAFEDVFDKIVLVSPVEEMNKLRKTLITAGPDGKQAWSDLKGKGIDYIKDAAFSKSQQDAAGNPLLSPDKFNRVVKSLDREGKLESLYGKKQAQVLRDLAELATVIYTAPPGAINTSNSSSAIRVALDSFLTFAATGYPIPAVLALKEAVRFAKNRKLRARINEALKEPK